MKIAKTTLTELRADEGKILVGLDGYGAKVVYLGIYDYPENYLEIPEEDYVEPTQVIPEEEIIITEEFEEEE